MDSYLQALTIRLFQGMERVPAPVRARHAAYLGRKQNPDGGFSGREGESDLYYTGFALRGLAIVDALTPQAVQSAGRFLKQSLGAQAGIVDFFSLLYGGMLIQLAGGPNIFGESNADWPDRVAAFLETLRTKDGGYAKTPGGVAGSTYHTFLVALCYQLLGKDLPDQDN